MTHRARAADPPRGFHAALQRRAAQGAAALIAEIKKRSPSKGVIRAELDPAAVAADFARGGASCLSVLTDAPSFGGSLADLTAARAATALPTLRKDFLYDPYQVLEARAAGADCVLLILGAVDDDGARALERTAAGLGMDVLVEVHDEQELERALRLDSRLIGVNNRHPATLRTTLGTTDTLAPLVPPDRLVVSESGIAGPPDVVRLWGAGARAFLVGESLLRSPDVAAATAALAEAAPRRDSTAVETSARTVS
jgi:indole-3-glycerol phosphate synthase